LSTTLVGCRSEGGTIRREEVLLVVPSTFVVVVVNPLLQLQEEERYT